MYSPAHTLTLARPEKGIHSKTLRIPSGLILNILSHSTHIPHNALPNALFPYHLAIAVLKEEAEEAPATVPPPFDALWQ